MKKTFAMSSIALATSALIACGGSSSNDDDNVDNNNSNSVENPVLQATIDNQAFVSDKIVSECAVSAAEDTLADNYINMACAAFEDSLIMAKEFQATVNTFTAAPNDANLSAARAAYKKMRKPYQQAEIMRFDETFAEGTTGIENVDSWEGGLNAWPLDETYINAIIEGNEDINAGLLTEKEGDAATEEDADLAVTKGFHAIEYVLWDRDENKIGAGDRAASEFAAIEGDCSSKECRLSQYLKVATDKVVTDLQDMVDQWDAAAVAQEGSLANEFLASDKKIDYIFQSMANMSVGELGGARLSAGLWRDAGDLESIDVDAGQSFKSGDREEEHDCFSDLSHYAVYYNFIGVANALQGSYTRVDGSVVEGPSVIDFVAEETSEADAKKLVDKLVEAKQQLDVVFAAGENDIKTFDQIIGDSEAHYVNGVAKTAELTALESAITALGQTEAIFNDTVGLLALSGFDGDGIGETD